MTSPWRPGEKVGYTTRAGNLASGSYSVRQEALWQALNDVYHAALFGYAGQRQPRPGESVDTQRYREWKARVLFRFKAEAQRDATERPLLEDDLPENLWRYWYSQSLAAAGD